MKANRLLLTWLLAVPAALAAQRAGLDPAAIRQPLADSWPSYSGDLTGRRYSALKQINKSNVRNLSLAWVSRGFTQGSGAGGRGPGQGGGGRGGGGRGGGEGAYPLIVSGEGSGEYNTAGPAAIRGS